MRSTRQHARALLSPDTRMFCKEQNRAPLLSSKPTPCKRQNRAPLHSSLTQSPAPYGQVLTSGSTHKNTDLACQGPKDSENTMFYSSPKKCQASPSVIRRGTTVQPSRDSAACRPRGSQGSQKPSLPADFRCGTVCACMTTDPSYCNSPKGHMQQTRPQRPQQALRNKKTVLLML